MAKRVGDAVDRHHRPIAVAQWACFAVACASYAGFVRVPAITIPAIIGLVLTALRYAVWEGWLKRRLTEGGAARPRG